MYPGSARRRDLAVVGPVLLAMLGAAGCGLKTPPQPLTRVLPVPPAPQVWQRDERLVVSWPVPAAERAARHQGVAGYRLSVQRLPVPCVRCEPERSVEVAFAADDAALHREGGRMYYAMPLAPPPALWRVRLVVRYGVGSTAPSPVALHEAPVTVPRHTLHAERLPPQEAAGESAPVRVRLYWSLRRESVAHVLNEQGRMVPRERFFRANVYRRTAGEPWPMQPVNDAPLEGGQFVLRVPPAARPPVEATLRLVDRFGNEGPVAPPLPLPPSEPAP